MMFLSNRCSKSDYTFTDSKVTDNDGNVYKTVTIGTQVWMVENLKTTKYQNGDLIRTTNPATLDISTEATPKYQWASNGNESNVNTYGRLYTWYAITDTRNVCQVGWHVPCDADWGTLTTFLDGESGAGGKLKEAGTTHWASPDVGATNSSGFTALPGGGYNLNGTFFNIFATRLWWSSTEYASTYANSKGIDYSSNNVYGNGKDKRDGYSIRCLRDF